MAVAGLSPISKSRPVVEYFYPVTGLTASALNSLVLTGVAPEFIPDALVTVVRPVGGAAFSSVSFNKASLVKDPTDATQVLIDVYTGAATTAIVIELA